MLIAGESGPYVKINSGALPETLAESELSLAIQVKLLRYLESGELQRVGGHGNVYVDAGRFRADLYYRLNVVPLAVPALRERPEEIEQLVRHFAADTATNLSRRLSQLGLSPRRDANFDES